LVAFLQVVRHELEEELPVEGLEELLLLVVDRPRTLAMGVARVKLEEGLLVGDHL